MKNPKANQTNLKYIFISNYGIGISVFDILFKKKPKNPI